MEKQKPWQLYLIIAIVALTIYNILPTVFYYSNPLQEPIDQHRSEQVADAVIERINHLEEDAIAWVHSFSKNLGVTPSTVALMENDPQVIEVDFKNAQDAALFKRYLPKAGSLIAFIPKQLELDKRSGDERDSTTVYVKRQISLHLDPAERSQLFHFTSKYNENGTIEPLYQEIINDRTSTLAYAFAGPTRFAQALALIAENPGQAQLNELVINVATDIVDANKAIGSERSILKRWYASFSQVNRSDRKELIQQYLARSKTLETELKSKIGTLESQIKQRKESDQLVDAADEQSLSVLKNQLRTLSTATALIEKDLSHFQSGNAPLSRNELLDALKTGYASVGEDGIQTLSLEGRHPFIQSLQIDWKDDEVTLNFYSDVQEIRTKDTTSESNAFLQEKLNTFIINDIARASSLSDETIKPNGTTFAIDLNSLTNTQSLLSFDLAFLAEKQSQQIQDTLIAQWNPQHADLIRENYPIRDFNSWKKEGLNTQRLGLIIYAPAMDKETPPQGFDKGSIYIIAKGLDAIARNYQSNPNANDNGAFLEDRTQLARILQESGFIGYPGSYYGIDPQFSKDYIFELNDYYTTLIKASREDFQVKGSKRFATLDFTNVEQRILARNRIEDRIQEDLLKWHEEYAQAQVAIDPVTKYLVPPPTQNAYLQNLKLSAQKYVRGDERKILKWGLDLSGGKTVRIGLRDKNNQPVTNPDDLKQVVNELYTRINKMGVSERTIRIENENIILDFPGSQGLSASELVKASAMYFHIVNEKFSPNNPELKSAVNDFLQNVWNEAVVTNRKDEESINEIAWRHLGGEILNSETMPKSEAARLLYENGLRIANPQADKRSSAFNDALSSITLMRGDDFSEWNGQSNPLVIVFHNYALEGSSLTGVQVGYDPSQGNTLHFQVKNSYDHAEGSPQEDFYAWTSEFSKDQISGTAKEDYTKGRGWRMAIVLNGQVISMPALSAALRDGGLISGRFTQREVDQLASDLKAGSLSFTPRILSEHNISPELGQAERSKGITASIIALMLVFVAMIGYYRFAGLVASCAVLFNLFIMWGVLQNLGAALTLPGIAGIVLTIGMAVDANVLVFERFREEFKISGRIASAIQTAYRKAFSAIIDSNVTTIIAALILLQFDSGPIKGFAVTLIIGIVSSMFTALFMTRYFFAGWVKNPKHKQLSMAEWIGDTKINFLSWSRIAFIASALVILSGSYMFINQRNTLFGMDFTGGYSLTLDVGGEIGDKSSLRAAAKEALVANNAPATDVDVRELSRPTQLRIQLSTGMEEAGRPFFGMPDEIQGTFTYPYENNPRLVWVISSLLEGGIEISESQLNELNQNWTVMSGQFSDAMRNNALIALGFALLCILIYITLRFELKYAVAAVIALAHDVAITLGILAFFHAMGFPVQINLETVGAIMTIIGYSLNDTIIVFDRIREDIRLYRKKSFPEIINHAINITLTRTLMTSTTTLLVLFTLVILGGQALFGFSLVMTIGVFVGTLSSLFIAAPVMLLIHRFEEKRSQTEHTGAIKHSS